MRIPFPERIVYSHALIFAAVLCGVQILERTNPLFSAYCFMFILVSTAAFNLAGGLPYPSGAFIGFSAIFTLIIPLCVKAVIGEPADSNLRSPERSVEVYLVGMIGMLLAALVTRSFRARRSFLVRKLPLTDMRGAYLGSLILGVLLSFVVMFLGNQQGGLGSFSVQINRFPALALLLGPMVTVRETHGRRSMSTSYVLLILAVLLTGLVGFSKEAFLTPFFCWAVAVAVVGYKLRWFNLLSFAVLGYVAIAYMIPYAQVGRDYENPGVSPLQMSAYIIKNFDEVRDTYKESADNIGEVHYYNERIPLLDRLDILAADDALINSTDRYGTFGYRPIFVAIDNFIPHFLWPNKPVGYFGNTYAHELGWLPEADVSTGISFSPSADAYHQGRVTGLLLVEPMILIVAFLLFDSVFGDVREHPIGLMMTLIMARAGNEGLLTGLIITMAQPLFAILVAAFFCSYVLPIVSRVFSKSARHAGAAPTAGLTPASTGPTQRL